MSVQLKITLDEAAMQRIKDKIGSFPDNDLLLMIATKVAQEGAIPRAKYYPPEPGRPQPFKTAKQRRAFFAMLRDGRIKVPYPRTMTLLNAWQQSSDGFYVENNTRYAFLVQGERKEQARYHQETGWHAVERIAEETEETDAEPLATAAVVEWIGQNL